MANNLTEQLVRVKSKTSVLMEKYIALKDAFDNARRENEALKAQIMAKDKEIESLRLKAEHLSIASTVKMGGDDIQATRDMIADLVREIDRCIADLSE